MPRQLLTWFILPLAFSGAAWAAEDRALLIGVGNYPAGINSLPGIDKDIASMRAVAIKLGFPPSSIHTLFDQESTLARIQGEIQSFLIAGGPKGRVLLYFSGHGSLVAGAAQGDPPRPILVNYDIQIGESSIGNALVGSDLGRLVEKIPSREVLVIADSCHSGRLTNAKGLAKGAVPKFFRYPGMPDPGQPVAFSLSDRTSKSVSKEAPSNHIVVAACRRDETAGATPSGSTLTVVFRAALDQIASAHKGIILAQVDQLMTAALEEAHVAQHPEVSGNLGLADLDWSQAPNTPPSGPSSNPSPGGSPRLHSVFDSVVRASSYPVSINLPATYRDGELMTMELDLPQAGYLNVVAFSQGEKDPVVLFPNRWIKENKVPAGHLKLPNNDDKPEPQKFRIRQHLPQSLATQKVDVYAVVSQEPINLYSEGLGDAPFKMLDDSKGPLVEGSGGKGAGHSQYTITK
jgi:hypothetical protein